MDPTEDLSARVLLQHILSTDPPRTPVTRSSSRAKTTTVTTSSTRRSRKDARPQTPQDILRRSQKHKLHQSITRSNVTKRASVALGRMMTPASTSVLFGDGDTPRHILRNILRTEPVKSPVVHGEVAPEEPLPSSADSSITRKHPSIELSGLDLPDLTIGNGASTSKGLARKRPRRSFNVTAFEKRLKDGDDVEKNEESTGDNLSLSSLSSTSLSLKTPFMDPRTERKGLRRRVSNRRKITVEEFEAAVHKRQTGDVEENEESTGDNLSLSSLSSTSLSLKTPFVDPRTERKGLQRRVSNRRKITVEEFEAAVHKRQMGGVTSFVQEERGLNETADSEGFTLGLSKLSEPDITTDVVHSNTALYPQPESMTSSFSIIATQDKPTVMASQLQRLIEHSELCEEEPMHAFPYEECAEPENEEEQDVSGAKTNVKSDADECDEEAMRVETQAEASITEEVAVEFQTGEEGAGDSQTEEHHCGVDYQYEEVVESSSQYEEEEAAAEFRTDDEGAGDSQTEGVAVESLTGEEIAVESLTGEEIAVESLTGEEIAVESQTEEEGAGDSQTEGKLDGVDSQDEEDAASDSQRKEEDAVDSQLEEEDSVDLRSVADVTESQSDPEEPAADSPPADEHDGKLEEEGVEPDLEHVSRRAQRSEGGPVVPVGVAGGDLADSTEAGCESKALSSLEIDGHDNGQQDFGRQTGAFDAEAESDVEDGRHLTVGSPEVDAVPDPAEQVEEWEDEEDDEDSDELPSKTPAFVKQKINFLQPDPLASPQFKNIQASSSSSSTGDCFPAPKPKQVRKRGKRLAKKETDLPKSYLMGVFKHFAKTKVSADVYPVLKEIMDKYFDRLAEDLETYAAHAKRRTIEVEDAELLLKRQGYVNDKVPVEVLIEKYLRMDQRKLLIPIATSGNVVIPKKRR